MHGGLPALASFRRIVVKVGSSLLVDPGGELRAQWLDALAHDIARRHEDGVEVLVVSSGAIALGRSVLRYPPGALDLERSQAAAAVGQIRLARVWSEALASHGMIAGQVLITPADTEERRRYLNARATLGELLARRAVPVINENDTVATAEIRYGDNDRLAARVATMAGCDLLVLLSDVDGLYTAAPQTDPTARLIPVVPRITAEIEAVAGGAASELSRGGMATKVAAAKIAVAGGAHMVIASGKIDFPLAAIADGGPCTWFLTPSDPVRARKRWIGGTLEIRGAIGIDGGAVAALQDGRSLLPAGVRSVDGSFGKGDAIIIRGPDGGEIGRGLARYDAADMAVIAGHKSQDIAALLGYAGSATVIHRDDLVLMAEGRGS